MGHRGQSEHELDLEYDGGIPFTFEPTTELRTLYIFQYFTLSGITKMLFQL